MTEFTIFPAIDLRHGNVVRLKYGDPARQTTFGDDPAVAGQRWIDAGATWLHVVNLDGAFDEAGSANWNALPRIAALDAQVQFGGGIRTLDDVERALSLGVTRVILGTVAVEYPELVASAIGRYGSAAIVVGIDARDGIVKTRGWQTDGGIAAGELGRQMAALGVTTIIHTDIGRDGVLTGVNWQASQSLATATSLAVIASGGVASLADIEACFSAENITGVITGRAIYDNRLDLKVAIQTTSYPHESA
ncbi:MAG: 1-(5-phosphoribosyl)-5-[(5-phosphoribosylamino)methylideneamino] imidazole-4-carboxamide isomerase [Anaerolineae bacterium]|nr:1-(5-phosphoribosyl)-5-[(5-phosphoribosylamino)methylideneamino] imidazole-4-carboxamide isomerase [Anaerolineae bacterium]